MEWSLLFLEISDFFTELLERRQRRAKGQTKSRREKLKKSAMRIAVATMNTCIFFGDGADMVIVEHVDEQGRVHAILDSQYVQHVQHQFDRDHC